MEISSKAVPIPDPIELFNRELFFLPQITTYEEFKRKVDKIMPFFEERHGGSNPELFMEFAPITEDFMADATIKFVKGFVRMQSFDFHLNEHGQKLFNKFLRHSNWIKKDQIGGQITLQHISGNYGVSYSETSGSRMIIINLRF